LFSQDEIRLTDAVRFTVGSRPLKRSKDSLRAASPSKDSKEKTAPEGKVT